MTLLLAVHAGLALWGAARNSVTFDENSHVSAGVVEVARGQLLTSAVNPPLVKALFGAAALAAGARLPADSAIARIEQSVVRESFMRRNADRYPRVFFAARLAGVALSVLLGLLVWRFARRLYGPAGALVSLGLYAFAPEALAHGGLATLDVATALGFLASVYAFWIFARTGSWKAWLAVALAVSFTFLTRFSALALFPLLAGLALILTLARRLRRPARVWIGLALLVPAVVLALDLGYLGHVSLRPLGQWEFASPRFQALQRAWPALRLPLPNEWIAGLDWQSFEGQQGVTPTYLLGRVTAGSVWYYFPVAIFFKWPLGFLAAILARGWLAVAWRRRARGTREAFVIGPPIFFLLSAMFLVSLNAGVRYVFPVLPFLCVWCGGLLPHAARLAPGIRPWRPRLAALAIALAALQAAETLTAAPWYISFFNRMGGGPGGGYTIVNDSNVDLGQGLIALREELARRGIGRIHLAYHGTADPALYGIDYVPYLGGTPGPESRWLAVSSYYFVGLSQRMMTPRGPTPPIRLDFGPLRGRKPDAVIAGCMYLFRVR